LALERAWRALMGDTLLWVGQALGQRLATVWLLLLSSLSLHVPARPAPDGVSPPLSLAARAAALLDGDFLASLADRHSGVWRPGVEPARRVGGSRAPRVDTATTLAAPTRLAPAQRRVLRQVAAGRLSAVARSLLSEPPAP